MTRTPLPRCPNRLDAIDGSRAFDEKLLDMIVGLTSELTVLRARHDALERLLVSGGSIEKGQIDSFEPDEEAQIEREMLRKRTMRKIFRPLQEVMQQDLDAAKGSDR